MLVQGFCGLSQARFVPSATQECRALLENQRAEVASSHKKQQKLQELMKAAMELQ